MAAKLLHSLTDDNPDLQKQIGCMTGIFQLFDPHHILTGRRISHKRLLPGNPLTGNCLTELLFVMLNMVVLISVLFAMNLLLYFNHLVPLYYGTGWFCSEALERFPESFIHPFVLLDFPNFWVSRNLLLRLFYLCNSLHRLVG